MSEVESEYVKLISSDGFEFVIHREAAIRSGTIKNMLCGPGNWNFIRLFFFSQRITLQFSSI